MSRKVLLIALLAVVPFLLVGCGSDAPDFKAAEYRIANGAIAEDLDLHTTSMSSDFQILGNTMEGLMMLGEGDLPIPGVATGYDVSEDKMTYTFALRSNATWANGDPVKAQDFVYAWQRAVDPATKAPYAFLFDIVENGAEIREGNLAATNLGIKAKSDYEVEVTLVKPTPWFIQLTAFPTFYPAHKATVEKYGDEYGKSAGKLMGNGPYEVTYWNIDYGIYLEKNENYWDASNVEVNSISHRLVKDSNTLLNMYNKGDIDRVGVVGTQYEQNKADATVKEVAVSWYLHFNLHQPEDGPVNPLTNDNVRAALALAIDKTELVGVMKPYKPADAFVPSNFAKYVDEEDNVVDYRTMNDTASKWVFDTENNGMYDFDEAQALLNQGLAELGETSITLQFDCFDSEGWKPLFDNIQAQLNELDGLQVELRKAGGQATYDKFENGEYEIGFGGWGPDYLNPLTYLDMWTTDNSHNYMGWSNEAYDALIEQANSAEYLADPAAQFELLAQAEDMFLSEHAIVPLAFKAGGVLDNGKFEGKIDHLFGYDSTWKTMKKAQ